ncbi:Gfo/Idh/MocA family oxidoreductase [bacterium]|nr:Gfo/Idh/MocA family oxidoreductase [bacterium]
MATEKKVRVGVIGTGGIAKNVHLPSLRDVPEAEVVAVCDLVESKARQESEKFSKRPNVYALYPEMIEKEQLDAVFVLTEPDRIFRPTMDALSAGIHVFMEKPPGTTTFQTETLLRGARKADRILMVGFNRRFVPLVQKVLDMVRERSEITQVEGTFIKHGTAAFCQGALSAWESDTIHAIDLVRWIAGGEPAAAATVIGQTEDEVVNRWNSVVEFDNGVTGILKANYRTGGRVHAFEIHGPNASAFIDLGFGAATCGARILFFGGKESYSISSAGAQQNDYVELDGKEIAGQQEFYGYYGFLQEDQEFMRCILENRRPMTDIEEGVKSMRFVDFLKSSVI